jgi:hypothetical protein
VERRKAARSLASDISLVNVGSSREESFGERIPGVGYGDVERVGLNIAVRDGTVWVAD